jgi:hypothetical protein
MFHVLKHWVCIFGACNFIIIGMKSNGIWAKKDEEKEQ